MDIVYRLQGIEFEWDENKALNNVIKQGNCMKKTEEDLELHFRPRAMETVSIDIPKEALNSLKKIAAIRDMSYQALLKFYIGQGLRQDLSRLFADRVLDTATEVLARHISSEEKVSEIIRELRETRAFPTGEEKVAA